MATPGVTWNTYDDGGGAQASIAPTGQTPGSVLLAYVIRYSPNSDVQTQPPGWTQILNSAGVRYLAVDVYVKDTEGGALDDFNVGFSTIRYSASMLEVTNSRTAAEIESAFDTSKNSAAIGNKTCECPSLAPTYATGMTLSFFAGQTIGVWKPELTTVDNGYIEYADLGSAVWSVSALATKDFTDTSPQSSVWTTSDPEYGGQCVGGTLFFPSALGRTAKQITPRKTAHSTNKGAVQKQELSRLYWYVSTSATPPTASDLKSGSGAVSYGYGNQPGIGEEQFSVTGLSPGTDYYSYFLQETQWGGSTILESGVWQTAPPSAPTATINLTDLQGNPVANMTGLRWSWFDQSGPSVLLAPADQGSDGTTDASGVFTVVLSGSGLSAGQWGWLEVTDFSGDTAADVLGFSGPVELT